MIFIEKLKNYIKGLGWKSDADIYEKLPKKIRNIIISAFFKAQSSGIVDKNIDIKQIVNDIKICCCNHPRFSNFNIFASNVIYSKNYDIDIVLDSIIYTITHKKCKFIKFLSIYYNKMFFKNINTEEISKIKTFIKGVIK